MQLKETALAHINQRTERQGQAGPEQPIQGQRKQQGLGTGPSAQRAPASGCTGLRASKERKRRDRGPPAGKSLGGDQVCQN